MFSVVGIKHENIRLKDIKFDWSLLYYTQVINIYIPKLTDSYIIYSLMTNYFLLGYTVSSEVKLNRHKKNYHF